MPKDSSNRRRSAGTPSGLMRKDIIIRAATKVFAHEGFSAATVREIADEAGMLSGGLYYYFKSKEALVEEVLCEFLDKLLVAYNDALEQSEDAVQALENMISAGLHGVAENREQVAILQNDWHYVSGMTSITGRQSGIEEIWLKVIERGVKEGTIRLDYEPRMIFRIAMGSMLTVIRWFDPAGPASIDDVIRYYTGILFDGIRARTDSVG